MTTPLKSPGKKSVQNLCQSLTASTVLEPVLVFYERLYSELLSDTARICSIPGPSLKKDLEFLSSGIQKYGITFLTKMLPSLGKALDKSLGRDYSAEKVFTELNEEFSFFELGKHSLPKFLGGYFRQVYDLAGNVAAERSITTPLAAYVSLLERGYTARDAFDECQTNAVRAIRQICFLTYKLELPYDAQTVEKVLSNFVETDASLPSGSCEHVALTSQVSTALDNAAILMHHVLKGFDPKDITPGHGPGSVATGEKPWEKMSFKRFYRVLDDVYPYSDYMYFSYTHLCDELESLELLREEEASYAKVQLVPKDSRGPRLISMEPLEIQWIQQGLGVALRNHVERPSNPACGFVNFTDQTINRRLALQNSYEGDFVTLDMKDASDRVSVWLIRKLFASREDVLNALLACRSSGTELPNGVRLTLNKFAPMGSAVCFPCEALCFWALAVGSILHKQQTMRFSRQCLVDLPPVYVYGDDLIIPSGMVECVSNTFKECFLALNEDKCCTGRFFRESCGADCFKGSEVQPVRCKALWRPSFTVRSKGKDTLRSAALLSEIAVSNGLAERGLSATAAFIRSNIEERLGKPIPRVRRAGEFACAFVQPELTTEQVEEYLTLRFRIRFNKQLQRREVKVPLPVSPLIKRGRPDWSELLRLHSHIGSIDPFGFGGERPDVCSFAVPKTVKLRGSWVSLDRLTW